MRTLLPTTLAVSWALGLGLGAGSLAIANNMPNATIGDHTDPAGHVFEMTDLPLPVVGNELFFAQNSGTACMDRDQVVNVFHADQAEFGGETVEVIRGRDQAFANAWRDQTGVARVAVSGVVAHIFRDNGVGDWTVDLVEFDTRGCAMSRTLLSGSAWAEIIELSASPSV